MKPLCSFIKFFRGGVSAERRNYFPVGGGLPTRRHGFRANKKAPAHGEKGLQNGCALLIFPKPMMLELELAPDIETQVQPVAVLSSGQSLDHSS